MSTEEHNADGLLTNFTTNAAWSRSTLTLKRRRSLTSACMLCSIAARSRPGSSPPTDCSLRAHQAMGLVADIFTEDVLAAHARHAGHRAYALLDRRRFCSAECPAHHGAVEQGRDRAGAQRQPGQRHGNSRASWKRQGSIFQTNSDTEVIVHLIALSKEHTLPEAIADALRRVEGAFSLVMMSADRIFAVRDPRGFRPLAMGRIPRVGPGRSRTRLFSPPKLAPSI